MHIISNPASLLRACAALLFVLIAAASGAHPGYTVQHFTNEKGLPGNSITGMEWDSEHQLLWIGTNAGIVRWDGQFMKPELEGRIYRMSSSREGGHTAIYATNEWGYIYQLSHTGLITEAFQPDNQLFFAYNRATDNSKEMLFRLVDAKINMHVIPEKVVPLDTNSHNLLLCLRKAVLLRWNGHIRQIATTTYGGQLFSRKELWLIDGHQIRIFNPLTHTFGLPQNIEGAPLPADYTIVHDVNTELPFVYGEGKLYQLKRVNGRLQAILLADKLPKRLSVQLVRLLNGTGCIALGDFTAGLYLLRPTSILPVGAVPSTSSLPPVVTYGQVLMPNREILTRGRVLISKKEVRYNQAPLDADFCFYSTGPFIYATKDEFVYQYHKLTRKTRKYRLPHRTHPAVYATTEGRSYLIIQGGIYELLEDAVRQVYTMPVGKDGLPLLLVSNSAIEFRKGVIAIGGDEQLMLFNTHTLQLDTIAMVKNAPIRALWRQGDYFFMGTYGKGIFVLKNGRVSAMPLDKQEYLNYTHCFQPDHQGYLYLSSNNGLFRVSEKAFLAAADDPAPLYYHYLGRKDGLFTTELNGGCAQCSIELPDSTLSFASMNGLAWVKPDSVYADAPPGIILLDSVQVAGRKYGINAPGLQSLPDGTEDIRFSVTTPYWGSEENLYCWYRLRNLEDKESAWIRFRPASQHDFSFSSLKKGDYRFEVALINGYERNSITYRQVSFTIDAPWYLKSYTLLLWASLLIAGMVLLVKWRTKRIQRRASLLEQTVRVRTTELNNKLGELEVANQLQERMISVVSHNIIAPLRYMHEVSADLSEDARSFSPALQQKAIRSIKKTAQEMELMAINLLSWIRMQHQDYKNLQPEKFHLEEVMERVYHILDPLARERGLELILEMGDAAAITQYKDAIQVILYNLAVNAVLYSGKGKVILAYTREGGSLRLSVTDEGKGMTQQQIQELLHKTNPADADESSPGQGFGYAIIRDMLGLINGTLEMVSEVGKGTTVIIGFSSED